jgi:hypothetical protein
MAERLHTYQAIVRTDSGTRFRAHAEGEQAAGGGWIGWLAFEELGGDGTLLRTDRETTQPDREKVVYWASGLEPVYLEGALERAMRRAGR